MSKLVEALLGLSGLGVINDQAKDIMKLFENLEEYDKRLLVFYTARQRQLCGRFGRSKRVGHISVEKLKRFSLFMLA